MAIHKRENKSKKGFTWEVDFVYTARDGTRKRHTKRGFGTKDEAMSYEIDKKHELDNGIEIKEGYTLNDVAASYFENDPHSKNTTKHVRRAIYNKHIKPRIGGYNIKYINYEVLQNLLNECGKEYSYPACENVLKVLNSLFKFAYNNCYIIRIPYQRLKVTGYMIDEKPEIITMEQFDIIIDKFKHPRSLRYKPAFDSYYVAMHIGLFTGMRLGEILALTRNDIDFVSMKIRINKQVQYVDKELHVQEVKTVHSRRTVPLPKDIVPVLLEHFETYPQTDLVVFNNEIDYFNPASFKSTMQSISKQLGIYFHFHMLRHTFTTQLWRKGIDIKVAQKILGHSSYQVTADIYTTLENKYLDNVTDNLFS